MSYSEQARILEWEEEFCRRIQPVCRDLGAASIDRVARQGNDVALPHYFRLRDSSNRRKRTEIAFRGFGYVGGTRVFGEPSVFEEPSEEFGEREEIIAPPEGLKRKVIREVKAREETSTDYRGAVSFAITHTDEVAAKAKGGVDGIAEGEVSAKSTTQTSLRTDFGWAKGQKVSREVTRRGETELNVLGSQTRILTIDIWRA